MPQAQDEAGNIWETDAQGNAVRLVRAAGQQGGVFTLPPDPSKQREQARADASAARDETRLNMSAEDQQRQNRQESKGISDTRFTQSMGLRDDYNKLPEIKSYRVALQQLDQAIRTGSGPQADLALTYAFAKAMDPESVVREAEQGMITNSQPWFQAVVEKAKKQFGMDGAGNYTPEARKAIRQQIINSVTSRRQLYDGKRAFYTELAKRNGVDPFEIVGQDDGNAYFERFRQYDESLKRSDKKPKTGYDPRIPDINLPQEVSGGTAGPGGLAGGGDETKSIPVPPQMQAEYEAYVRPRLGNLNPQEYAAFRRQLHAKYQFPGDNEMYAQTYADEAAALNQAAQNPKSFDINLTIPPATAAMSGLDKFNNSVFNNSAGAAVLGAGSLGGFADEAVGGLAAAMGGDYELERDRANGFRQASQNAYPGSSLAGEIGGSMMAGYGIGRFLPGAASAFSSLPRTMATGAAYGGVTGAGENNENRLAGATGGAVGGAIGGAVGRQVLAPVAERVGASRFGQAIGGSYDALMERLGRTPNRILPPNFTPDESAVSAMSKDISQVQQNLNDAADLGLPYTLADADPRLRSLAGTVARRSPEAYTMAENAFDPRFRGQADRAKEFIDSSLAPITDIERRGKDLLQAGNAASTPYYTMSRQQTAPIDAEVNAFLDTPAGRDAIKRAYDIAGNEMRNPNDLGFAPGPNGEVTLTRTPSFETLDLVKRGLDARLNEARNPITNTLDLQGNPQLQAIEGLRKGYVARLDQLNENYPKARAAYAKYAKAKDALETGTKLPGMLPRQVNAAMGGITPDNLPELQRGFATALADKLDRARMSGNAYEAIYGAPAQQQAMNVVFPNNRFGRLYDLERDMNKTRYETIGGSPTAQRLASDQALGGGILEGTTNTVGQVMTGGMAPGMGTAMRIGGNFLVDRARLGLGKTAEKKAESIASVLFRDDPRAMSAYIDQLVEKQAANLARKGAYKRKGGLFGATFVPTAIGTVTGS